MLVAVLALSFGLLHLASAFSLITMFRLHMGLHGGNASHRESIRPTGQAHLIMFADMIVESFIIGGPEGTQRVEVCIHPAAL